MKKNYFLLLCLLIVNILAVKAQPEIIAPNPVSTFDYPKVKSIYGPYDKTYNFSDNGTTITSYGSYGMKITETAGWSTIHLNQIIDLGAAPNNFNKLYFVYYGDLANIIIGGGWENRNFVSSTISGSSWKLGTVDISDLTTLDYLRFPVMSSLYIANICLTRDAFDGPQTAAPTPPDRATCAYLSVFSDSYTNTIAGSWNANGFNAFQSDIQYSATDKIKKVELGHVNATNNSTNVYQKFTSNQDISYGFLHLDIWLPQALSSDLIEIQLRDPNYGSSWGEYLYTYLPAKAASAASNGWHSVDIPLADLILKNPAAAVTLDNIGALSFSIVTGATPASSGFTFYVDNIYFYSNLEPQVSPETPTMAASKVKSVYSDVYTSSATFLPGTGGIAEGSNHRILSLTASAQSFLFPNIGINVEGTGTSQNMLHLNVWVPPCDDVEPSITIKLSAGNTYTLPTPKKGVWNNYTISASVLGISTTTTNVNSLAFTGAGKVYIDNVYFYQAEVNVSEVVQINCPGLANNLNGTKYYSISDAISAINGLTDSELSGKTINIELFQKSKEAVAIEIPDRTWTMLNIYPTTANLTITATIPDDYIELFKLTAGANNVTLNGAVGNTGSTPSLTIFGNYSALGNSTIFSGTDVKNIFIKNCIFKGPDDMYQRPNSVISATGENVQILNNNFIDCMFLRTTENSTSSAVILVLTGTIDEGTKNKWLIENNHFYETQNIVFDYAVTRTYINVVSGGEITKDPEQIVIRNNKIGGNDRVAGAISGTMEIGKSGEGVSSIIIPIEVQAVWPNYDNYMIIEGNEIANIDIINRTTGIWQIGNSFAADLIPSFVGIYAVDGLTRIKNNTIHNINLDVAQLGSNNQTRYLMFGINTNIVGGNGAVDIDGNNIYGLRGRFSNNGGQSFLYGGIFSQVGNMANYAATKSRAIIRNNRIMTGYNGSVSFEGNGTSIFGLGISIPNTSATPSSSQIDIYGNIVNIDEFSNASTDCELIHLIDLTNSSTSENDVVNCYNNIAYLQETGNFAKAESWFSGITAKSFSSGATTGITNIFHNTVYLKNIPSLNSINTTVPKNSAYGPATFTIASGTQGGGDIRLWNNNFVNENTYGMIYFSFYSLGPKSITMDYNNYYSTINYDFNINRFDKADKISTFDNWKFSNSLSYLGQTTEHDHHSRYLDPDFKDKADITLTTSLNLTALINNLAPQRFLGGRKTEDAILSGLSVVLTDATNYDINGVSSRRAQLPTIGAVNTAFNSYLPIGGGAISTNPDTKYSDLVVPAGATSNYTLGADLTAHDIYNDTQRVISLGGNQLTVNGYVGLEGNGKSTIDASENGSSIVYAGNDGYNAPETTGRKGAAAQHIFAETFKDNKVNNLTLNNISEYFVLLHGKRSWVSADGEPTSATLNITNDFRIINPDNALRMGALNCNWYRTNLWFSGYNNTNTPNLTETTAFDNSAPDAYRPYAGQRIPRYGIYNDEMYNLTSASQKVITYSDTLYVRNDLVINAGGNFEIAADKFVKVEGVTTNNEGTSGLVLKARELGDDEDNYDTYLFPVNPRPNATFIFSNGKTNPNKGGTNANTPIPATVEMHATAQFDGAGYKWQYFTVPVKKTDLTAFGTFRKSWIRRWAVNPVNRNPYFGTPYWLYIQDDQYMGAEAGIDFSFTGEDVNGEKYGTTYNPEQGISSYNLQGYEITHNEPMVHSITGNLTNDDYTLPLTYYTYNKNQPYYYFNGEKVWSWDFNDPNVNEPEYGSDGFYVVGNPYTAAIKINELTFTGSAEAQVHIYHTGSYMDWVAGGSDTGDGKYVSVPLGQAGLNGLPDQIPTMQGFSVKRTDSGNASFGVSYSATTIDKNRDELRSVKTSSNKASTVVNLTSKNYTDRLWIFINPETGKGYDNGWDGDKMMNGGVSAELFTIEDDRQFQVSSVDNIDGTYLGVKAGVKDTEYTITFNHKDMEDEYTQLYLIDLEEGNKKIDITADGSKYVFTITDNTKASKRFQILGQTRNETGIEDEEHVDKNLSVYANGQTIFIDNKTPLTGMMHLYNISGELQMSGQIEANKTNRIESMLPSGVYVVHAFAGNFSIQSKVIIVR